MHRSKASQNVRSKNKSLGMKRKTFIKNTSAFLAGGLLLPQMTWSKSKVAFEKLLPKIGVQLFSLPAALEKDFEGTIAMLASLGYREIELFGPYPFSAASAHEGWKAVTPMLGFSGSGYFGLKEQEIKEIFDRHEIQIPAAHTDLDTLENHMEALGKAGEALGFDYVVLPAIPEEHRKTLEDYKTIADRFNQIGRKAKQVGLKFAYHNHGYGFHELDGQIPLHLILDNTDPELVFFEMDLFWTIAGRADPLFYLEKYSGRYHLMHVKDMKEKKTFSGDGGDPSQWIALFPNMTSAGNGVLPLEDIIAKAMKHGVKHFFVEQDMVQNPEEALGRSYNYLAGL